MDKPLGDAAISEPTEDPYGSGLVEAPGPSIGAAFLLGAVVGAVVHALLTDDASAEDRPRVRTLLRRRTEPPSQSLSDVAHEEATRAIRGVFREAGRQATRWILAFAAPSDGRPSAEDSNPET